MVHRYSTLIIQIYSSLCIRIKINIISEGHLKEIKLRLNAYEAVNRRNRLVTWELQRRVDSLKTNLHLSDNTYKVFGNEQGK